MELPAEASGMKPPALGSQKGIQTMPGDTRSTLRHHRLNRRGFLKIGGIATVAMGLSAAPAGHLAYAAALTKAQRDKLTPDAIIELMQKGNQRFRLGRESPHDYLAQQKATAKGQYPAAVILSCIDSRAPAETIMDLAPIRK
jgi:carbonic anhydrase